MSEINTVVFDVGGVLLGWDPRNVYRGLIADEAEMEAFLSTVTTMEWNAEQDRGRTIAEGVRLLTETHPQHAALIAAYYDEHLVALSGEVDGSIDLLRDLHIGGVRLLALTNYSAETFPLARSAYDFFELFEGIVVSGEEKVSKPDPEIYQRLLDRYAVDPARAVYVDDNQPNVDAALEIGFAAAVRFTTAAALRAELEWLGLPI